MVVLRHWIGNEYVWESWAFMGAHVHTAQQSYLRVSSVAPEKDIKPPTYQTNEQGDTEQSDRHLSLSGFSNVEKMEISDRDSCLDLTAPVVYM